MLHSIERQQQALPRRPVAINDPRLLQAVKNEGNNG